MAQRLEPPKDLPTEPKGLVRELLRLFRNAAEDLKTTRAVTDPMAVVRAKETTEQTIQAIAGDTLRLAPPSGVTIRVVLPKSGPTNKGRAGQVCVILEGDGTVIVSAVEGLVQDAETLTLTRKGTRTFTSDGGDGQTAGDWWLHRSTLESADILDILALAYPVGSIYFSTNSTNPATSLGFGTWTAFGAGRVPVGFDAGQTEFDADEETGGSKTHTLTTAEMPSHTHTQDPHAHTITDPGHNHNTGEGTTDGDGDLFDKANVNDNSPALVTSGALTGITIDNATATNQASGGGGAHNNLQPYIVVRMWKRTA